MDRRALKTNLVCWREDLPSRSSGGEQRCTHRFFNRASVFEAFNGMTVGAANH